MKKTEIQIINNNKKNNNKWKKGIKYNMKKKLKYHCDLIFFFSQARHVIKRFRGEMICKETKLEKI